MSAVATHTLHYDLGDGEPTDEADEGIGAQGIGVQLLYHRQPVVLNHEMTLGSASAGRFTLPLTARYYQTRSRITAGRVGRRDLPCCILGDGEPTDEADEGIALTGAAPVKPLNPCHAAERCRRQSRAGAPGAGARRVAHHRFAP